MVRHGRYHIEREDLDDQKLTEMGRNQLTQTGKYLAGIYKEHHNNEPPEIIISSVSFLNSTIFISEMINLDDDSCNRVT